MFQAFWNGTLELRKGNAGEETAEVLGRDFVVPRSRQVSTCASRS